jgi:hypothetical protein
LEEGAITRILFDIAQAAVRLFYFVLNSGSKQRNRRQTGVPITPEVFPISDPDDTTNPGKSRA